MPGQKRPAARARLADSAVPNRPQPAGPTGAADADGTPGRASVPPPHSLADRTNHPAAAALIRQEGATAPPHGAADRGTARYPCDTRAIARPVHSRRQYENRHKDKNGIPNPIRPGTPQTPKVRGVGA